MRAEDKSKMDLDGFVVEASTNHPPAEVGQRGEACLRRSFRTPVDQNDRIQLKVQSECFDVLNSSETGLQVLLKREDQFRAGETIDPVEISFSGTSLKLKGKVIHVSQTDFDEFTMGIQLVFPGEAALEKFREHHKERLSSLVKDRTEPPHHQK